jgi:hypothetical protein
MLVIINGSGAGVGCVSGKSGDRRRCAYSAGADPPDAGVAEVARELAGEAADPESGAGL